MRIVKAQTKRIVTIFCGVNVVLCMANNNVFARGVLNLYLNNSTVFGAVELFQVCYYFFCSLMAIMKLPIISCHINDMRCYCISYH